MNKKVILSSIILLLMASGIIIGLLLIKQNQDLRQKAAAATTMTLTTDKSTVNVGEKVTVTANVQPQQGNEVISVRVDLNYDPSLLSLDVADVKSGTLFGTNTEVLNGPNITENAGKVNYSTGMKVDSNQSGVTVAGSAATFTFTAVKAGQATVSSGPLTEVGGIDPEDGSAKNLLVGQPQPVSFTIENNQAPGTADLSLEVSKQSAANNETIPVNVMLSTSGINEAITRVKTTLITSPNANIEIPTIGNSDNISDTYLSFEQGWSVVTKTANRGATSTIITLEATHDGLTDTSSPVKIATLSPVAKYAPGNDNQVASIRFDVLNAALDNHQVETSSNLVQVNLNTESHSVTVQPTGTNPDPTPDTTPTPPDDEGTGGTPATPTPPTSPKLAPTTTPSAKLTINIKNGQVFKTATPTFTGTAPAGSVVSIVINSETITGTATATSQGRWSFTPPTPISEGQHTITVSVRNADGTTSTQTATFTINTQASTTLPQAGTVEPTILILGLGVLLLIAGTVVLLL